MPVVLAVMEIPGCLVALALVARMRASGKMDLLGNMPGEPGYDPHATPLPDRSGQIDEPDEDKGHPNKAPDHGQPQEPTKERSKAPGILSKSVLHDVFLNSGLYLLFGGIVIGFISGLHGAKVTAANDVFFVQLFPAILCLFLIEMGMTSCKRLQDLRTAGWKFILFGLLGSECVCHIRHADGAPVQHVPGASARNRHLPLVCRPVRVSFIYRGPRRSTHSHSWSESNPGIGFFSWPDL